VSDAALAGIVLFCAAGTYLWRALGVMLAGTVRTDSPLFEWVGCVAYAMIAGLCVRIVVLPTGALAAAPLSFRVAALVIALGVYVATRRNLFLGVGAGFLAILALPRLVP
jgi:branched-subunit amino acid transport protein